MRGKLRITEVPEMEYRITPAHAGKTQRYHQSKVLSSDHPRACGENTSEMAYFRG